MKAHSSGKRSLLCFISILRAAFLRLKFCLGLGPFLKNRFIFQKPITEIFTNWIIRYFQNSEFGNRSDCPGNGASPTSVILLYASKIRREKKV